MTRKLTPAEKKSRKPAVRACTFCHDKHLQCSNERPCKNCVKRNIGDKCQDVSRKRARYLKKKPSDGVVSEHTESPGSEIMSEPMLQPMLQTMQQPMQQASFPTNNMLNTTKDVMNRLLFESTDEHPRDAQHFTSNYLNQEYNMLGDIIKTKPSSPSLSSTSLDQNVDLNFDLLNSKILQKMKDSRPFISLGYDNSINENINNQPSLDNNINVNSKKLNLSDLEKPSREHSYTNLKNVNVEYISPLTTHNIYQSVQDIYSNSTSMNFDYPQSYHSLTKFLKSRFLGNNLPANDKIIKRNNLLIILKLIASYRPTFISAHKNLLKPQDLQFLEMTFQRSLIDYEKLCHLNSCPTVMWRRTGEIVLITDDLLSLLGYNLSDLLSKKTFIMELMYDDDSIIRYFENFKFIAVGNLLSSIHTRCKLLKRSNESNSNITNNFHGAQQHDDYIEFCSVWTVKRDIFDMPMLIIGQFLPVLSQSEGMRMY